MDVRCRDTNMDELPRLLYEKFFLRDFLGKIVPAGMLCISLLLVPRETPHNLTSALDSVSKVVLGLLVIGVLWIIGVSIQTAGEGILRFKAYPNPRDKNSEKFFAQRLQVWSASKEIHHLDKPSDCSFCSRVGISEEERNQRERYVVIKEAAGNGSMAVILSLAFQLVLWLISLCTCERCSLGFTWSWKYLLVVLPQIALALALWFAHGSHALRQAKYEIGVIEKKTGLVDPQMVRVWIQETALAEDLTKMKDEEVVELWIKKMKKNIGEPEIARATTSDARPGK